MGSCSRKAGNKAFILIPSLLKVSYINTCVECQYKSKPFRQKTCTTSMTLQTLAIFLILLYGEKGKTRICDYDTFILYMKMLGL
ncbi:hypothetical protein L1987_20411 [Smallanthus sonchifolius]|uniref:Uncharacterized protein n=1 Tax=Smallanthus sonchifolius TaxID=185202 RepID=A0ACB9IR92_9ASTR|nr:hypothetical protein L1987_20411 [Smallanthus sonchifolius]